MDHMLYIYTQWDSVFASFSGCGMIKLTVRPINDVWEVLHKYTFQDPSFSLLKPFDSNSHNHQKSQFSLGLGWSSHILVGNFNFKSNWNAKSSYHYTSVNSIFCLRQKSGFCLLNCIGLVFLTSCIWFVQVGWDLQFDDLSQPLRLRYKAAKSTIDSLSSLSLIIKIEIYLPSLLVFSLAGW